MPQTLGTPIKELGLSDVEFKLLTPAAQKLTKSDLINLSLKRDSSNVQALTIKDLNSINAAFSGYSAQLTNDVSCCCCTPCCSCSAAATTAPFRAV